LQGTLVEISLPTTGSWNHACHLCRLANSAFAALLEGGALHCAACIQTMPNFVKPSKLADELR